MQSAHSRIAALAFAAVQQTVLSYLHRVYSSQTPYNWISFLPDWFNIFGGTFGCRFFYNNRIWP